MKNTSSLFTLGILCALALIPSAQAAVGLSVTPASITNDYVGKVTLTMTGLSTGQTVLVERFSDVNGNGVVDAATDRVARSFTVTDGQLPIIGGVRNLNVPGDDDGVVNGQIRVDLDSPGIDIIFGTASGTSSYRVSDPVNGFTPVTRTFTVAQKNYSQGIRGRITAVAGGAPLAGAFVVLLDVNGHGIGGASTDANGNYALNTQPGSYLIIPLFSGYIANGTLASATVVANQFTTNNQALATGAFTISGRLTDATSGAGIAGVSLLGQSTNNLFSFSTLTDTSGNYSLAVSPSQWRLDPPGDGTAQLGYLRPDRVTTNITTASAANVNFALPKVTALIYGTVKDELNNPINGVETRADDQTSHRYEGEGRSFAPNANYALGVVAGSWWATVESDTLPPGYTSSTGTNVTISAGQAVQVNLILSGTTAHLLGKVVNSSGTPQSGLSIQANPQNGGNGPEVVTAGDGSFDLGVSGGAWTIQLHNDNGAPGNLIGPNMTFNVTDGVNISNINFVVLSVTAQITGIITNTAGSPLGDLGVYASATISGTNYNQYVDTDGSGHFSIGVINGTWQVGVDCQGLNSRGYSCLNDRSVSISGANGVANFLALTPGSTPPSLLSSSPANGASDVSVNSSVLFTFSEPMQSGVSINWNVANTFFYTWSADQRTLVCNNNTLPAGSTISWILNPSAAGQSFRDLDGNALPSNVSGSFTTAGTPNASTNGAWTYKPFIPTARAAPGAAIINGLLYVVGGSAVADLISALEVYDPNQGTWESLAPMRTARSRPAVGVINGKLYVAGGAFGVKVLEVYDPVSNTWTNKQPMNISHQGDVSGQGAAGVIGNKLYVVGPSTDFTKSLEVYDPITDTWTFKTPMPNPRPAAAAVLNGLLYTVGGDIFGTVEAYDPTTDSWSSKASLPGPDRDVYYPGVAVLNGKLYVVGGFINGTFNKRATVDVYDPTSNQWSYGPSMLSARGDLAVAALSDRLFAVGGTVERGPGPTALPYLEQLNLGNSDSFVTLVLRSDASTLAAGLGSGVPSTAMLNRLNAGDTSGLTFQSALVGAFGSSIYLPTGAPIDTQVANIPTGNGQNGFFQLSFVLPPGYSGVQISCGATMDYFGRAFLNGNALTPAIDSAQPTPAPGTIVRDRDTFFSTKNPAFFHTGTNYLLFADINADGGASAGSFYCLATYRVPPSTLSIPAGLSGDHFQFTLAGDSGAMYRIEATTNLSAWTVLGTNPATGGSFLFVDPAAASGFNNRFYRAVLVP